MKIILFGANGTVGKHVYNSLKESGTEIIKVGKKSGDVQVRIEDPDDVASFYKRIGHFDAVANAAGEVAFAPFSEIKREQWELSLHSKLMGQINLVQLALPYIRDGGSFTLISGILGDEQIRGGTVAATVNCALEGFVKSAAFELPRNIRINAVSPTVLEDSMNLYGDFFPGFIPVKGEKVGLAFKKSIFGVQSGKVFKVT